MRNRDTAGIVAAGLVAAPVVLGGGYSLAAALGLVGTGANGFDPGRITRVLGDPETWRATSWTLATAGVATLLATAAATTVAVRLRHSRSARWLAVFPLGVPHLAAALAALLLLGQSGLLSRLAFAAGIVTGPAAFPVLVYDRPGVALTLAFAWKEFPFLVLTALAILDTRTDLLADVARTLGASKRQIFRRVTWPLLWRGLSPAVIAAFAFLIGQYEMAALLAPSDPTPLSVLTFERASDPLLSHRGDAHVLGLLALMLAATLVVIHERLRRASGGTAS